MNSGKSTALINAAYNYEERGLSVVITKPSVDTKGDKEIVARAGLTRTVDFLSTPELNIRAELKKYQRDGRTINSLLVDEAQFLQPQQVDQLLEIAKLDNISVVAFGLRTDFLRVLFPGSSRLFELADTIVKLPTMCRCGSQAEFNIRQENGRYVFSGEQVAIDGKNDVTYDSLCGACYLEEKASARS